MVVAAIVMQWSAPYSLSAAVLACSVCVGGEGVTAGYTTMEGLPS